MEEQIMRLLRRAEHYATRGDQSLAGSYFQKAIAIKLSERGSFIDVLQNETFGQRKEEKASDGSQSGKNNEGVQEGQPEVIGRDQSRATEAGSGDRSERSPEGEKEVIPPAVKELGDEEG